MLDDKKCKKLFCKVVKKQNMQNYKRSDWYTDDNKSKYSSNIPAKVFLEKLLTEKKTSKAVTTEYLTKITSKKKIYNEQFNLFEAKMSLNEVIKPKSSWNLLKLFKWTNYRSFRCLLHFWNLGTMCVEKLMKKISQTTDLFHF